MMPKKVMREKHNIKSPDRSDTYCFSFLANYVPVHMTITDEMLEQRSEVEEWLMEEEAAA